MHHSTPLAGSSPLTRGKRLPSRQKSGRPRLIPAHAGKTVPRRWTRNLSRAHPRSRGENRAMLGLTGDRRGSSPLTRGKRDASQRGDQLCRLIPAHAGKTCCGGCECVDPWAHPRSRGENFEGGELAACSGGSSPLTRGKRLACCRVALSVRLIPAHAGKTHALRSGRGDVQAHPRSRGENQRTAPGNDQAIGSSPLTRGKQAQEITQHQQQRLIPAHAGKTPRKRGFSTSRAAHPRSRGENNACGEGQGVDFGSSPLTRGKPRLAACV